jgi:hypothetical protein
MPGPPENARLLIASGARVDALWHAAALGRLARLGELPADSAESTPEFPRPSGTPAQAGSAARGSCCPIAVPI